MQVLCRGGVCGVRCRFNFVECVVWWLMCVVFVVHFGGSVVLCRSALLGLCFWTWDLWSEVHFDGSSVPVKGCSVGCCVLMIVDKDVAKDGCLRETRCR